MSRALRWMRHHEAEAAAVAEELLNGQLLVPDHHHIVLEPSLVDRREAVIIQRSDINTGDLYADLCPQKTNLHHSHPPDALDGNDPVLEGQIGQPPLSAYNFGE